MNEDYIGTIRLWPLANAPRGWANCDGAILSINQYQSLYALILNTFGGDPNKGTFALPDLRGLGIIGSDQVGNHGIVKNKIGTVNGQYTVGLTASQIPPHTHSPITIDNMPVGLLMSCDTAAGNPTSDPKNASPSAAHIDIYASSNSQPVNMTTAIPNTTTMTATVQSNTLFGAAHTNIMPSLALNYIICVSVGKFPQPS